MALLFGASVVGTLNDPLWARLPAMLFGLVLVSQWYLPRQIRRRIETLSKASPPDRPGSRSSQVERSTK
jgi:hypothetical protein